MSPRQYVHCVFDSKYRVKDPNHPEILQMNIRHIKPISEIYLRVQGELKLLKIALLDKDLKKIMCHRTALHNLTTDFEISLEHNEKNSLIHYKIKEVSADLLMLVQYTLSTVSHYLSMNLKCL